MRKTKWTSKVLTFLLVFSLVLGGLPVFAFDGETHEEGSTSQNGYYGYDVGDKAKDLGDGYNQDGNDNLDYGYGQDKYNNLDNGYDEYENDKYLDEDYEKDVDENYDYGK